MATVLEPLASKHDPRCMEIAHPNLANFALSVFILVGILVSYLPQHYRIIARRSSEGLSPYFILLGTTSGTCAIANILLLPTSRMDVACCNVNSAFSCAAGLLGIAQVGVQWSCFFLITLLFLIFIPRAEPERRVRANSPYTPALVDTPWRSAVLVVAAAMVHFILTLLVSVIVMARFPKQLLLWANILGTTSAIVASVQYLPQIWTTWQRQHIGSLSIPMMCIQTPGSFVFAASLAIRLGARGWSAWIVYIVTGSLQAILLIMAIRFELRDRREGKVKPSNTGGDDEDSADESDPLLGRDRLAEQNRQSLPRAATHLLHPDRLQPDPVSSSSGSEDADQHPRAGSLAGVASALTAPFRRSSTMYYDAQSRRSSRQAAEEEGAATYGASAAGIQPNRGSTGRISTSNGLAGGQQASGVGAQRSYTVDGRRTGPVSSKIVIKQRRPSNQ